MVMLRSRSCSWRNRSLREQVGGETMDILRSVPVLAWGGQQDRSGNVKRGGLPRQAKRLFLGIAISRIAHGGKTWFAWESMGWVGSAVL